MASYSKIDYLISELAVLEAKVNALVQRSLNLEQQNKILEQRLIQSQAENESLKRQLIENVREIERMSNSNYNLELFESLGIKDREGLKIKIDSLIDKINKHLVSS